MNEPSLPEKKQAPESAAIEEVAGYGDVELVDSTSTRAGTLAVGLWFMMDAIRDVTVMPIWGVFQGILGLTLLARSARGRPPGGRQAAVVPVIAGLYFMVDAGFAVASGSFGLAAFSLLLSMFFLTRARSQLRSGHALGNRDYVRLLAAEGQLPEVYADGGPRDPASTRVFRAGCGAFCLLMGTMTIAAAAAKGALLNVASGGFFTLLGGFYVWQAMMGRSYRLEAVEERPERIEAVNGVEDGAEAESL